MLTTNDPAAVDSLTAFATTMDYALDEAGDLAFLYNVRLEDVAWEIDVELERKRWHAA